MSALLTPRRRLVMVWTCSNHARHRHRWRWTAWLCGRLQAAALRVRRWVRWA